MKLLRFLFHLIVFFILSVGLLGGRCLANDAIKVTFGDKYKPFAWADGDTVKGVQVDFVHEILEKRLHLQVKYLACPWKRCQREVRKGVMDGFFTVPTDARAAYTVKSSIPFYETHFVMHTSKNNPKLTKLRTVLALKDMENMPDIRHVHMFGSGWHEQALKNMPTVIRVKDASLIPRLLVLQRADVYIEQEEMVRYQARALGVLDQIETIHHPSIRKLGWYLFISRRSSYTWIMPILNAELEKLRKSGELERIRKIIFKKYGIL